MNKHLQNRATIEELVRSTSARLKLRDFSFVEKDLYVTLAIQALTAVENPHFKLIFQGGTCLAKAHRLVQRMSEDCDFRIVFRNKETLTKEKQRNYLRAFRMQLINALEKEDFIIDASSIKVRNEGQFIEISATYPSIFPTAQTLKPHLALEFFLGELRLPPISKQVTTLVKQILGEKIEHPEFNVEVMSITETAAEKWVALTRRVATSTYRTAYEDQNLVRHLYDLHHIHQNGSLDKSFPALIAEIVKQDAEHFKTHNLEYYKDPDREIKRALADLEINPKWKNYWNEFIDAMVFDPVKPIYEAALVSFSKYLSSKH